MKRLLVAAALSLPIAPSALADDVAVHAVPFSHEDVGYADSPYVLRTENRLKNIFRALQYCDETAGAPATEQYRYHQEVSEPIPYFLSVATPEERERFAQHVREGRMRVAASHTTVIADRLNPESFARLFYVANRHMPDMLGVPPSKIALINDVTGLPWSTPIYCDAAQIPWIFHGHNSCGRCDELDSAPLVRWTGAGGTGSVLVHGETYNKLHAPNVQTLLGIMPREVKRSTPENLSLLLYGWDFAVADRNLIEVAQQWNPKNPEKKVRISTLEDWYPLQEKRKTPPVVAGKTGPCQWADQPIGDAWAFGRARTAAEYLPTSEIWNSVALATGAGKNRAYPWFEHTVAWHALLSNFEHTAGAACWRCKDEAGFTHYETEQVEHRDEANTAHDTSRRTLDSAIASLAAEIATPHKDAFAVFNPSGRARTEPVRVFIMRSADEKRLHYRVVDDATGEGQHAQWIDDTTIAFTARDVPALGYRTYRLVASDGPLWSPMHPNNSADSPFYKISFDPATGCITSLFDKQLGKELVKKGAPQSFNQYLRLHIENPRSRDFLTSPAPSDAQITYECGPVADIVRVRAKAENTNALEQTITLWHGVKRVDFALRVDKRPSGRTLSDYFNNNMRGKEAVFTSLPFDIPGFKAAYQTGGGGIAEPVRDQFKGTGTAFHAVQHFADISNEEFGVTVCPENFALVEFGPPRADAISRIFPGSESAYEMSKDYPKESTLQLFLMSNMFSTNIRIDQPGLHEFRWSLRSHAGNLEKGRAPEFGEEVARPLVTGVIPQNSGGKLPAGAHSFASVSEPNVAISTLKPAEWNGDGYIVRLVETSGRATKAMLNAPFLGALAKVEETDLVEADLGKPLAFSVDNNNLIRVELPAFGVKTLRLIPASAKPAAVEGLATKPLSDMEVALEWKPVAGASFYRVYRGDKADFHPTPFNLVAVTAEAHHTDKAENHGAGWITNRLEAGKTFHYRVEAVGAHNLRGALGASAAATTATTPTCAPGAVLDLRAIPISPLAPINKVNLLWRSNPETNVTAYEIHRATEAGFTPGEKTLLKRVPVMISAKGERHKLFDHQAYLDGATALDTTYRYRVRAVTADGRPGAFSEEVSAKTKKDTGKPATPDKNAPKVHMGNDAAA